MYSWRIQSASFLVRLQESKGRSCIVIFKKKEGGGCLQGKTPLISLGPERQQSLYCASMNKKTKAEQEQGRRKKKKNCFRHNSCFKTLKRALPLLCGLDCNTDPAGRRTTAS